MTQSLEQIFLEELDENKESLLRICSIYASDSETKKDFFQESILNIWKSLPSFKNRSSLNTWMYRITINVCLKLTKQRLMPKHDFVDINELESDKNSKLNTQEEINPRLEKLQQCISVLNESNKALIALYLEEIPYKNIAEITGLTENHVAVKLKRIRKKLFNCINQIS